MEIKHKFVERNLIRGAYVSGLGMLLGVIGILGLTWVPGPAAHYLVAPSLFLFAFAISLLFDAWFMVPVLVVYENGAFLFVPANRWKYMSYVTGRIASDARIAIRSHGKVSSKVDVFLEHGPKSVVLLRGASRTSEQVVVLQELFGSK